MVNQINLPFNPKTPTKMHIDLNSCFATIEQQANPLLRGKPIVVAAYDSPGGCIVAPSIEAKRYGIKTGMRVKDGKLLYRDLVVLLPDPWKYRNIHFRLKRLLEDYTEALVPKSIDEFVLDLEGYPAMHKGLVNTGAEIKDRIKKEVGDWLTVNIGISTNRFLAKTAAGLNKPDGLDQIDVSNYMNIYKGLSLTDISGIKSRFAARLSSFGIHSTTDFYLSSSKELQKAFHSIIGHHWYLRLHGWEIDDVEFPKRSFGNSVALGQPVSTIEEVSPILQKLVEKIGTRMRKSGYRTKGVHVSILYKSGTFWHHQHTLPTVLIDSRDIYKEAYRIFLKSPYKGQVRDLAVSCFNLVGNDTTQLELFDDFEKKESLVGAVDKLNERYGDYTITPGMMLGTGDTVKDRIAFGNIKELEDFIIRN